MRTIVKQKQDKFVKVTIEKLLDIGAILQPKKYEGQLYQEFILDGANPCTLTLYPTGHHQTCYTVFGRFEKSVPRYTGPSAKYNFHESGELDGEKGVLDKLDFHLDWVVKLTSENIPSSH